MRLHPSVRCLPLVLLASLLSAVEVGGKSPGLDGVIYLQGVAPSASQPMVVDFWATWCAPCKVSIPHLSALAKRHAGKVAVVGLSDEDKPTVMSFIAATKMEYTVGLLGDPQRTAWLGEDTAIPKAFLVGADGTVLWKGSPLALDPVIDQVLAGTWDVATAIKLVDLQKRLQDGLASADIDDAAAVAKILATAKELLALSPADEESLGVLVGVAQHQGDPAAARAVWDSLDLSKLSPSQAANLARMAGDQADYEFRNLTAARALALRAVAGAPGEQEHQEILARIEYACGRIEDALTAQGKAVELAKDAKDAARQQGILDYYRAVVQLRAGQPVTPPAPRTAPPAASAPKSEAPAPVAIPLVP